MCKKKKSNLFLTHKEKRYNNLAYILLNLKNDLW